MIYIIGSGLSAMAAAVALVRRGRRPMILDAGLRPDPVALTLKARLAAAEPDSWEANDLAPLRRTGLVAANGIPRKLHFGSDFVFRDVTDAMPLNIRQASMYRSFAAGGFSNVWGAVIQPLPERELRDWPITSEELSPHYAAVHALLSDVSESGSTGVGFPAEASARELHPSSQAQALYADLSASRHQLEGEGIRYDYAQLAVRATDRNGQKGCRYCGLCLYGCPYDCRYSAASTLTRLISDGQVGYIPDVVVDKLSHDNGQARIEGRSLANGAPLTFWGRQVFVAAGLLETSRIILASLGLYDTTLQVRHSDIFTLPVVRYRAAGNVVREKLHTLCQIVAEIEDDTICSHPVHLQFYGYNDLYLQLMVRRLGWMARPLAPALRVVAARLFVIFGYLHSNVSSSVKLTLSGKGDACLHLEGQPNPQAWRISQAVARKLFKNRTYFHALPLILQPRLDLPGGGYHSGGTFPMRHMPKFLETDRWGSLPSFPNVHLIDASVLPTIPASPMAFTVMANAHRIASECPVPHGP
jgi:choline dehydrogenase-like flavoprotein